MKSVSTFDIRLLPGTELSAGARAALERLGLEPVDTLGSPPDGKPVVLLANAGAEVPTEWREHAVEVPDQVSATAFAAILRLAMENAVLRADAVRSRQRFEELNRIGIALSSERDIDRLQGFILQTCRQLTAADGASLWLLEGPVDARIIRFASTQNHSLDVPYSSFTLPLTGNSMVGHAIISGRTQVVDDVYNAPADTPFGLGGSQAFDEQHGYRTVSMLCVPMRDHAGEVVGAVQLINAKVDFEAKLTPDNVAELVTPFDGDDVEMIESIASQAAVALDNKQLLDAIQALFEGFVKASVTAIESRDPTTYGHSGRVAALTVGLAEQVSTIAAGGYRDLTFTPDQLKELRYAALLHDFGKVGVREHVLVKEKKLYPSQIDFIRARFEFVQRSRQLHHTEEKLRLAVSGKPVGDGFAEIDRRLNAELEELRHWLEAVLNANEPSILDEDKASMLEFLSRRSYDDISGAQRPLLEPQEFHFLSIKKGTLDERERLEIESHVTHSYRFLTKIPWTPAMKDIPLIAYGHHEKLDGTGYPRRVSAAEIPVQTRMMTISDIFDALTATDRPYKRAVPLDRALGILKMEADEGKLDADLLDVFIARRVYEAAESYRPDEELLLTIGAAEKA